MLNVRTDLHTHSIFSMHAYSTIEENLRNGAELGMEAVGISDHYSGLFYPTTEFPWYSHMINYKALPQEWYGVRLFRGAEADIVDLEGHLFGYDIKMSYPAGGRSDRTYEEGLLYPLDYVIASVHDKRHTVGADLVQTTKMYLKALDHPKVLILGHIGRSGVPFDLDEVLLKAKAVHKLIEINDASFGYKEAVVCRCREIAVRCAELGVGIAIDSDAHSAYYVGRYKKSIEMLEEIHFPEELIMNRDLQTVLPYVERTKNVR